MNRFQVRITQGALGIVVANSVNIFYTQDQINVQIGIYLLDGIGLIALLVVPTAFFITMYLTPASAWFSLTKNTFLEAEIRLMS